MVAKGYYTEQAAALAVGALLFVLATIQLTVLIKAPNKKDIGAAKKWGIPIHFIGAIVVVLRGVDPQSVIVYPFAVSVVLANIFTAVIFTWLHALLYSFMFAQYLIAKHRVPKTLWHRFVPTCGVAIIATVVCTALVIVYDQEIYRSMSSFIIAATILILAFVTIRAVQHLKSTISAGGITSAEVTTQLTYISRMQLLVAVCCMAVAVWIVFNGSGALTTNPPVRADPEKYQFKANILLGYIGNSLGIIISWLPLSRAFGNSDSTYRDSRSASSPKGTGTSGGSHSAGSPDSPRGHSVAAVTLNLPPSQSYPEDLAPVVATASPTATSSAATSPVAAESQQDGQNGVNGHAVSVAVAVAEENGNSAAAAVSVSASEVEMNGPQQTKQEDAVANAV